MIQAALAAGVAIPHLCYQPGFAPHGSCRVCVVEIGGRLTSACTTPASAGLVVRTDTTEIAETRRSLTQMLFVEGNHFCPSCEKSGHCQLQNLGYSVGMLEPGYSMLFPKKEVDASHPDVFLDRDRCILCELCVRASRDIDGKNVFGITGRGIHARLAVNSATGKLGDSDIDVHDRAVSVCPVGALFAKLVPRDEEETGNG